MDGHVHINVVSKSTSPKKNINNGAVGESYCYPIMECSSAVESVLHASQLAQHVSSVSRLSTHITLKRLPDCSTALEIHIMLAATLQ